MRLPRILRNERVLAAGFLLLVSYFTYVHNFWVPQALFWDENYHIASAQKYLNGVFFMEPHPPLGKLVIAAGEALVHANAENNQFIATDYATNPPPGFSFVGYRLFPTLLAWLTVPIVFGIFLLLVRKTLWATLLSFLYVFDNALIVHGRSAMLESTMLFFCALTLLAFFLLQKYKSNDRAFMWSALLFGTAFAAALATKVFALLFILLVPIACVMLWPKAKQIWTFLWVAGLGFAIVYLGVWYIHFSVAQRIVPSLPDNGYYQASELYKALLANEKNDSVFAIPIMLRDSINFVGHYQKGVPRLDLCKADENGSPWFFWPFGARTINYRWETPDGSAYRYLYLMSNPVGWGLGLIGIIVSAFLLLGSLLFPDGIKLKQPFALGTVLVLYACFMIAVSTIDRVMYLYHYFIPLFFSFILFGLVLNELQQVRRLVLTDERKTWILMIIALFIFAGYQVYRPLTYYQPLTEEQFQWRNVFQLWELQCVGCDDNSMLAVPRS